MFISCFITQKREAFQNEWNGWVEVQWASCKHVNSSKNVHHAQGPLLVNVGKKKTNRW